MKQKIAFSFLILFLVSGFFLDQIFRELKKPIIMANNSVVEVLYGDSIYQVAEKLEQNQVVNYPLIWIWYARIYGMAEQIKAGEYQIESGKSSLEILDDMVKGNAIKYTVTFIEGWTTAQAIKVLQKSKGIVSTLNPEDHEIILKSINAENRFKHSEGLFYPDTYQYSKGTKDRDILLRAFERMMKELNEVWSKRAENLPYKTPYDALIMGSIIEKESGVDNERKQIAGVFVERIAKGMRLQTDPTVIYGMGESYKGNITRKDLVNPTEYNTYTIDGLPPSPIALVSRASMEAAVHPLLNGMIFFVAKGNGYHVFSKTLEDHERAVREYQLSKKENYRSTPEKCNGAECNEIE